MSIRTRSAIWLGIGMLVVGVTVSPSAAAAAESGRAQEILKATGVKGRGLFMPLRVALTGVTHGPEMARVWEWLGVDSCRSRLQGALDRCLGGTGSHG